MPIRVSNLRLSLDEPEAALAAHVARSLGIGADAIARWRILRKSLDARRKDALQFVYTAEVCLPADEDCIVALARRKHHDIRIDQYQERQFEMPAPGTRPLDDRPGRPWRSRRAGSRASHRRSAPRRGARAPRRPARRASRG